MEIDLIAFLEDFPALFCECTVELPSDDKVRSLANRATSCLQAVGKPAGRSVLAVCVPVDQPVAAKSSARAQRDGVCLIDADDLDAILTMAQLGESPAQVLAYISRLRPGSFP